MWRSRVSAISLLGFEIGDLRTGKKTAHIEVKGFHTGPVKRHGCPSHGIALTPDEREIWLADAFNESIHIFGLGGLQDETGAFVQSEKMVEVQFAGKLPVKAGDQFGLGRAAR